MADYMTDKETAKGNPPARRTAGVDHYCETLDSVELG